MNKEELEKRREAIRLVYRNSREYGLNKKEISLIFNISRQALDNILKEEDDKHLTKKSSCDIITLPDKN